MKPETRNFITAFLDGFTMAGLSEDLDIPGLPTRMFAESQEEAMSQEELEELLRKSGRASEEKPLG